MNMKKLHDFLIPLLAAALVAYFALAVSACGSRVMPEKPEGKIYSSGQY